MKKERIFQDKNVYEATQERLDFIFAEFGHICLSFSGGKDSSTLVNLVLDYIRDHGIRRRVILFYQDFEAIYSQTTEHVREMFERAEPYCERYWMCLPIASRLTLSSTQEYWYPWDDETPEKWVRPMPTDDYVINLKNNPMTTYKYKDKSKAVRAQFGAFLRDKFNAPVAQLLGLRAEESLRRYSGFLNRKHMYKEQNWIGLSPDKDVWLASPLYDWKTGDIWHANAVFNFPYNRLYDDMYYAGVPVKEMRVASPFHASAVAELSRYKELDPAMWQKMLHRVDGVNFAALYGNTELMGYKATDLPDGHSWQSYSMLMLSGMDEGYRRNFERKLAHRVGVKSLSDISDPLLWREVARAISKRDVSYLNGASLNVERKKRQYRQLADKLRDL